MLAVGGSGSVRYRNRDAKIGRLILKGEDPYRFRINQADFELVNLAFPAIPDVYKDGPHELVNVVVSVKTGAALTKATGLAVLNFLSKKFNTRDMMVSLRNDAWFIEDDETPIVSPFFNSGSPLGKEQYYESITLRCSLWGGKRSCMTSGGFKPQVGQ